VLIWAEHFAFLGGFPRFIVPVGGELDFPSFAFADLVRAIGRLCQLVTLVAVLVCVTRFCVPLRVPFVGFVEVLSS
jgi:hypothetical protein